VSDTVAALKAPPSLKNPASLSQVLGLDDCRAPHSPPPLIATSKDIDEIDLHALPKEAVQHATGCPMREAENVAMRHGAGRRGPKTFPKDDAMPRYRVTFSKELFGLPFPVAEISVMEALNEDRACRAATLRFMRRHGVADWRLRADRIEIERQLR
jgi:hypothetical protein